MAWPPIGRGDKRHGRHHRARCPAVAALLHTGRHEVDEIPATVTHLHTNPFDDRAVRDVLNRAQFDLTIAMYGRLRRLAEIMRGRTARFISVGGGPAYRGYMNAAMCDPPGLPVP